MIKKLTIKHYHDHVMVTPDHVPGAKPSKYSHADIEILVVNGFKATDERKAMERNALMLTLQECGISVAGLRYDNSTTKRKKKISDNQLTLFG